MKVILLPGLDGTGRLLADISRVLSDKHAVTVFSYPLELTSYEQLGDWLDQRLPHEPYIIVAESFSGPLAIRIALQQPPSLKGIVFVATFARPPWKAPFWLFQWLRYVQFFPTLAAWLSGPFVFGRDGTTMVRSTYRDVLREVPFRALLDRISAIQRLDDNPDLSRITLPCIYLQASRDRLVPPAFATDFTPCCGPPIPVDAPHFLLQTNYQEAAKQIDSFMSKLV